MPGFIPKNARVNYAGRLVVIPRFDDMASCEEERSLCPRRAVNVYRKRSELYRKTGEEVVCDLWSWRQSRERCI